MARDIPMSQIIKYMWPYIAALVVFMALMMVFPKLALFLPGLMQ